MAGKDKSPRYQRENSRSGKLKNKSRSHKSSWSPWARSSKKSSEGGPSVAPKKLANEPGMRVTVVQPRHSPSADVQTIGGYYSVCRSFGEEYDEEIKRIKKELGQTSVSAQHTSGPVDQVDACSSSWFSGDRATEMCRYTGCRPWTEDLKNVYRAAHLRALPSRQRRASEGTSGPQERQRRYSFRQIQRSFCNLRVTKSVASCETLAPNT
ncbi:uncharacterized protein LOC143024774 [Oratosquilla oratoria]|uniref:uncharacterized protein LOC143024774 n=1 Tax=Oratosquilla oratoria TaxID=337810 RepID=UPI003F775A58